MALENLKINILQDSKTNAVKIDIKLNPQANSGDTQGGGNNTVPLIGANGIDGYRAVPASWGGGGSTPFRSSSSGSGGPIARLNPTGNDSDKAKKRQALEEAAQSVGVDPRVLGAIISFESAGTFNPDIKGGDGGNYRGLIQFGIPERAAHGVRPGMTFEEQVKGPVVSFLKERGVKPGDGADRIYAAILTGSAGGNLNSSDSNGTSVASALSKFAPGGDHYENARKYFEYA